MTKVGLSSLSKGNFQTRPGDWRKDNQGFVAAIKVQVQNYKLFFCLKLQRLYSK